MENPSESLLSFDLEKTSAVEVLRAVQSRVCSELNSNSDSPFSLALTIQLVGARGQDFIGAGLRGSMDVTVNGAIGDFGFCSFADGECHVVGDVGSFFGHSISSGVLVASGNAKNAVGALGSSGLIAIYGNAGHRTGIGMQGSDVVIRGSVADYAGLGMQNGTLIIGGSAGKCLGHGMRGGTIYIRGDAESISSDIEQQRLREPDRLKIGMLLLKSNIKSGGKEFRVFRPCIRDE